MAVRVEPDAGGAGLGEAAGDRRGDHVPRAPARRADGRRAGSARRCGRRSTPPSPRTASVTSGRCPGAAAGTARWGGTARTPGPRRARRRAGPARPRRRWPSAGLVVLAKSWPKPPVASSTAGARSDAEPAGVVEQRDAADDPPPRVDRVDGDVPGQQRQPAAAGGGDQRPLDLRARGVARRRGPRGTRCARPRGCARAPRRRRGRRPRPGPAAGRPRRGPPARIAATAASSQRPAPAATVSATCAATLSPGTSPSTTAIPPCAQRVEPASGASLVTTTTRSPSSRGVEGGGEPGDPAADDHEVRARLPARRPSSLR